MSDIEKIYGPQAKPLSREVLRSQLDNIHLYLTARAEEKPPGYEKMSLKERERVRKEQKEKAEKVYKDLEGILEVALNDRTKLKALQILFYLILAVAGEGYKLGHSAATEKAA